MRSSLLAALCLAAAAAAQAQAPRISPKGDPSVRSDTIYRLAVDPAEHPEEDAVFLLDDGVLSFQADGTGSTTFRQVVQVLTPAAVENYNEFSFSYEPAHQKLTVNWIRVVRPDGTVISERPSLLQESDIPANMSNPVYNDSKVVRASLAGVEPGVVVDYSYTLEERKPYYPGSFYQWWGVSTGLPVRRSRLLLDLPSAVTPRIVEKNLNFARRTTTAGGRTQYAWITADIPRVRPEPLAADSNGVWMSVAVAAPTSWAEIGRWYASLARGRYTLDAAAESRLGELVRGARTREDSIRAVHRWAAQDVRYLSVALGIGGYQPRTPAEVVRTGFGDCKDKATLFVAGLQKLGITAYPVLLNSGGGVERGLPSVDQFDHAIAAVRNPDGRYTFTDLTASIVPYGQLPHAEQGEFALVVHPDGTTEEVTLPRDPITANESVMRLDGELSADGAFTGTFEQVGRGVHQYKLREAFWDPLKAEQTAELTRALATNLFTGATGSDLKGFDGKDFGAEARVSFRVTAPRAASRSGETLIFTLPFGSMAKFADAAAELEARTPRRFPIDAESTFGWQTSVTEIRLRLPDGMRARLPDPVKAESPFGSYTIDYEQAGRTLTIRSRSMGARGVHGPEKLGEVVAWYRAMARDDAQFLVIEPAGGR